MPYQSTANSNAFVMGSARIAILSSVASTSYFHLGSARGIKITEAWEPYEIEVDNCPLVVKGIKNQTVTIEGTLLELNLMKLARMRAGLDSFSTTTFSFTSGGNVSITPQAVYITHNATSTAEIIQATIHWASVTDPLVIPYPSDSGNDVAEIPFKMKGTCASTGTVGQNLYTIIDYRIGVYAADPSTTAA